MICTGFLKLVKIILIDKDITKKISKEFTGLIWKTWIEENQEYLLVETRDGEGYQTKLSILDLNKNVWIWDDFILGEEWWLGVASIYKNVVFFYTYEDNERPEPSNLFAIDIFTKKILWKHNQYKFSKIYQGILEVYFQDSQSIRYTNLDYLTGKVLDDIKIFELQNSEDSTYYPQSFKQDTNYFKTVAEFIKKTQNIEILHLVDYLEHENLVFLSFFFMKNSDLHNNLLILNAKAQILLHENINIGKKIAFDTFFLSKNYLVFVKNKKKLIIYNYKF